MKNRRIIMLACVITAVLLAAGCGKSAATETVDTAANKEASEAVPEETTTEASEKISEETVKEEVTEVLPAPIADGVYTVDVETDSTMFHLNETSNDKGILTVKDGQMTLHITLAAKGIVNLFPGTAEEAKKEGAVWIEHSLDEVTYSDGAKDEAYGFDIPTPYLDEPFPCAIVGTKGNWYDHEVTVSNPEPAE